MLTAGTGGGDSGCCAGFAAKICGGHFGRYHAALYERESQQKAASLCLWKIRGKRPRFAVLFS